MSRDPGRRADQLRGASRLAIDATLEATTIVQDMHRTIASGPAVLGKPLAEPARLVTDVVYGAVRGVTGLVGRSLDVALEQLAPVLGETTPGPEQEALVAVVNGVVGDHLVATGNPLATELQLRRGGQGLPLDGPEALGAALPRVTGRLLLTVHGSCMNDRQWLRRGHDHAAALSAELGATRVDVLYNTGLHISDNGDELARVLEALVAQWPTELHEIVILAHSMGGLVSRSACWAAERASLSWRERLRSIVFLGTPHHGAPLERGGNVVDALLGVHRYSAPLARLGRIRSAGVTDLRFGSILREHWAGRDRFELTGDPRSHVPLPRGVSCYAVAGRLPPLPWDGMVPVTSALGDDPGHTHQLAFPEGATRVFDGVGHLALLQDAQVYDTLRGWLAQ